MKKYESDFLSVFTPCGMTQSRKNHFDKVKIMKNECHRYCGVWEKVD